MKSLFSMLILSLFMLILSCASKNTPVNGYVVEEEPICSNPRISTESPREVRQETSINITDVIIGTDTLNVDDILCIDSVLFTQAFGEIDVPEICLELGIQGNTYFIAKTNKFGGFEEVEVARSVHHFFKEIEEKIKQRVLQLRTLSLDYGNATIIFNHRVRLH